MKMLKITECIIAVAGLVAMNGIALAQSRPNKRPAYFLLVVFILSASAAFSQQRQTAQRQRPNIIYILADDLGYGDVGVFFQQQRQEKNDRAKPAGPLKRGFDYYYGYIAHGHGHEHYPKEGLYRKPKPVWENRKEVSAGLDNCYTGDLFTTVAKKYIIDRQKKHCGNQPFFLYLAYDTPHAVLELPAQAYPEGKGLEGGLKWIGTPGRMINTASGKPDSWVHPDYVKATYDHDHDPATPEVAWPDTYKRYATIVRRIDSQVGDILQLLKDLGIAENTLVVFTSDNGPSKESYLPKEKYVEFTPSFFGGFGPFDGIKRDVLEGGVRMPAIAWWPGHIRAKTRIETSSISYDWTSYKGNYPWLANMEGTTALHSGTIRAFDLSKIKAGNDGIFIIHGYICVPDDGAYTFSLKAGGKAFLRVHETAVIDADYGYESGDWKNGKLRLMKGLHPIKIYYTSGTSGEPDIELMWEGPSFKKIYLPGDVFFREHRSL